jgi:hypothetical protein
MKTPLLAGGCLTAAAVFPRISRYSNRLKNARVEHIRVHLKIANLRVKRRRMTPESSVYPLRLPRTMRTQLDIMARRQGISLNQFICVALAEKMVRSKQIFKQSENPQKADPENRRPEK